MARIDPLGVVRTPASIQEGVRIMAGPWRRGRDARSVAHGVAPALHLSWPRVANGMPSPNPLGDRGCAGGGGQ